jgi:hypothetical protein
VSPISYTTPATFVAGSVLTAAGLNTNLRDNLAWLATDSPACHAYRSTDQNATSGSSPSITFDQEHFDDAAMHSTSSNTQNFTLPTGSAGKYLVGAIGGFPANGTGTDRQRWLALNAAPITRNRFFASATVACAGPLSIVAGCSAADVLTLNVFQDSGSTLAVNGGQPGGGPEMYAYWYRT